MSQNKPSLPTELLPENLLTPETLIPTKKIIELAQRLGVDFGAGNPEERIRYYIKLGLLPHAVRKVSTENVGPLRRSDSEASHRLENWKFVINL